MIQLVNKESNIELDVRNEGWEQDGWKKDGWELCPVSSPLYVSILWLTTHNIVPNAFFILQLTKRRLDGYTGGPAVPAFQIELKMLKFGSLKQPVGFLGVTPKETYIVLKREPKPSTGSPTRFIVHVRRKQSPSQS